MNNEEEIMKEVNKLFVTMANVHIDGKPMADLLQLYEEKKEEAIAISKSSYIAGAFDERNQWYKKIYEKIEFYKRYGKIKNSDEYVMSVEIEVLQELIGKEE